MPHSYKNRPVLVTGAMGYLGSALTERLLELGAKVSTLSRSKIEKKGVQSFIGDIRQKADWKQWVKGQEIIFHLAAQTNHKVAAADVALDWTINCQSFLHLLEACRVSAPKTKVVLASTVTAAGLDDARPHTYYDVHKLCNEGYLHLFSQQHNLSGVVLRLANVFGPSKAMSKEGRGILNWMVREALEKRRLTVFGTGEWMRDYVYIDDVIEAFILSGIKRTEPGANYDVVSGVGIKFLEAVQLVAKLVENSTGQRVVVNCDANHKLSDVEKRSFVGDIRKVKAALNWKPTTGLRDGLLKLLSETLTKDA